MPTPQAVEKKAMPQTAAAGVRRITLSEGQTPESVLFPNESVQGELPVMQSTRPMIVTDTESGEQIVEAVDQRGEMTADWIKDFSMDDQRALESFQGDPAKIAKAFLDTKRGYTDKAMEAAGVKQMIADMLEAQKTEKEQKSKLKADAVQDVDVDALLNTFSDDDFLTKPKEILKKVIASTRQAARAEAQAEVHPYFEELAKRETTALLEKYPGMVTAENAKLIDAIASNMDGGTQQERYTKGLKEYAKLTSWKPAEQVEQAEIREDVTYTEQMRTAARMAPNAASVPNKKKVWTRAELTQMHMNRPDDYARLQPEIIKAYSEGRVK